MILLDLANFVFQLYFSSPFFSHRIFIWLLFSLDWLTLRLEYCYVAYKNWMGCIDTNKQKNSGRKQFNVLNSHHVQFSWAMFGFLSCVFRVDLCAVSFKSWLFISSNWRMFACTLCLYIIWFSYLTFFYKFIISLRIVIYF